LAKLTTGGVSGGGGRYDPPYAEEYGGGYGGYAAYPAAYPASYPSTSGTSGGDVDAKTSKKEEKKRLLEELQRLREVQEKVRTRGGGEATVLTLHATAHVLRSMRVRAHRRRPLAMLEQCIVYSAI